MAGACVGSNPVSCTALDQCHDVGTCEAGTGTCTNPAKADSDDDGFDDSFEINTGFDPNSGTSTPEAQSRIRTAVEFEFNAAKGVNYRIEASVDLGTWEVIETGIPGTGGIVSRLYSIKDQPKRYFRARRD